MRDAVDKASWPVIQEWIDKNPRASQEEVARVKELVRKTALRELYGMDVKKGSVDKALEGVAAMNPALGGAPSPGQIEERAGSNAGMVRGAVKAALGFADPRAPQEMAKAAATLVTGGEAGTVEGAVESGKSVLATFTDLWANPDPEARAASAVNWLGVITGLAHGGKVAVGKITKKLEARGVAKSEAIRLAAGLNTTAGSGGVIDVAKLEQAAGKVSKPSKGRTLRSDQGAAGRVQGPAESPVEAPKAKTPTSPKPTTIPKPAVQPAETPIVEPVKAQTAPKPAPEAKPAPKPKVTEAAAERPKTTGLANQVQEREAIAGVLKKVEPAKGRSPEEWQAVGEDFLNENKDFDYEALARDMREGTANLSPENASTLLAGKSRLMAEVNKAARRVDDAPRDAGVRAAYEDAQARLQNYVENAQEALHGPWSDIGRVMQAGTDVDTGSFASVIEHAKRTGPPVSPKEEAVFKAQVKQIEDLTARNAEVEAQLAEARATASVSKGRKVKTWDADAVRLEIDDIFNEFADLKGAKGVTGGKKAGAVSPIGPDDVKLAARRIELAAKLTKSYAKLGVANLEELIVKVQGAVRERLGIDISRQEVIDAFAPQGGRTMTDAKKQLLTLKQQARRMSTTGQEARAAELSRQIKSLEGQIKSGEFREPSPKERFLTQKQRELEAERDRLSQAVRARLKDRQQSTASHAWTAVIEGIRGTKLGTDFGMLMRQGLFATARPKAFIKGLKSGAEALFSDKAAAILEKEMWEKRIGGQKMSLIRKDAGLSLSDSLNHPEEMVIFRMVKNVPIVGKLFAKPLERGQMAFINTVRSELFDAAYLNGMDAAELKLRAKFINSATGRGNIREVPKLLQTIMTSPRYEASRWEMLGRAIADPITLAKSGFKNKAARANVQDMAVTAAGIVALYKAAELAGYTVEWNPDSSDFGKVRKGDDVWDVTAGIAPRLRDSLRVFSLAKRLAFGEETKFGESVIGIAGKAVGRTLSPAIRTPIEFASARGQLASGVSEKDLKSLFTGYKLEKVDYTVWAFAPLIASSMYQTLEKGGDWRAAAFTGAREFVGTSVQNYPKSGGSAMPSVDKLTAPWGVKSGPIQRDEGETDADYKARVLDADKNVAIGFQKTLDLWKKQKKQVTDIDVENELKSIKTDVTKLFRGDHPLPEKKRPVKKTVKMG